MGSVFRARDTRLQRDVALKVLPLSSMRDERRVRRFEREARAAAQLSHPNVVTLHDVGEQTLSVATPLGEETVTLRYLVEELVEGSSLRKILRAGALAPARVAEIALGVARGLRAAHEKGLVHRDLKPENVLIDSASGRPKIADFGLVRFLYPDTAAPSEEKDGSESGITRTGFVVGTIGYMSPEQARGDPVGPESDIFVFGVLLYELLTAERPFARADLDASFRAVLKESPPPLRTRCPDAPPELAAIVGRCLEKKAENRFRTADELVRTLEVLARRLAPSSPPTRETPVFRSAARHRTAALVRAAIGAGLLAASFGAGFFAATRRSPGSARLAADWRASVVPGPGVAPLETVLSADGRRAALTFPTAAGSEVAVVDLRGDPTPRPVSGGAPGAHAPAFSPDGSRLVFSDAPPGGTPTVWEASADGPRALVADAAEPSFSPDGKLLAFARRRGDASEILVAPADGSAPPRRLLGRPRTTWRWPVFGADGRSLYYLDVAADRPAGRRASLRRCPLDVPADVAVSGASSLFDGARPFSFAPDRVAALSVPDRSVVVFDLSGGEPERLPFGASLASASATPDGRRALVSTGSALLLWRRP